jgi:hypothetical protein
MATKAKSSGSALKTPKVKRPGVHSKCKTSKSKNSKHYKKAYRGQGR